MAVRSRRGAKRGRIVLDELVAKQGEHAVAMEHRVYGVQRRCALALGVGDERAPGDHLGVDRRHARRAKVAFDGNVWAVGFVSSQAYRVNPTTGTIDTFNGLVEAYTYSDMTGFALSSAGTPSG